MGSNTDCKQNVRELVKKYCIKDIIINPKISVIVPAYNSEEYIAEGLLSLLKQTLKEIEIIIVDDGSTDSTYNIIRIFGELDSRIKIITQENQGQGVARNNGIQQATGEYIGFVDSDDWIDLDYFEKLYNAVKKYNSDIAVASILKHKKNYKKYNVKYIKENVAENIQDKIKLCGDKTKRFFYASNKIYKTDLIKNNDIKFAENQIYEDVIFAIKALYLSNKVVSVPVINYHYIGHKNSTVKSNNNKNKKKNDYIKAYTQLQQYCRERNIILPDKLNYYMNLWYNPFVKTYIGQYKAKDMLLGIIPIKTKDINYDFPVDLVYLWVNGSDPEWKKKKEYWQEQYGMKIDKQAIDESRFIDNEELKFSLRSAEKYASWVNKIYIVTDNQIPSWLDTNNPKIEILFHEQFIPKENLPLFNSEAIESYLPFIPNLSEHFLYANDDMLFGGYVNKQFFYDIDNKPIVRLKHQVSKRNITTSMYTRAILHMQQKIQKIYGKSYPFAPHHNIDAYRKSDIVSCMNQFKEEFKTTETNKFRTDGDMQRTIFSYYALATNRARLKRYSRVDRWLNSLSRMKNKIQKKFQADSIIITSNTHDFNKKFAKYNPKLFCINDDENMAPEKRAVISRFLNMLYPDKSSFEKAEAICQV